MIVQLKQKRTFKLKGTRGDKKQQRFILQPMSMSSDDDDIDMSDCECYGA